MFRSRTPCLPCRIRPHRRRALVTKMPPSHPDPPACLGCDLTPLVHVCGVHVVRACGACMWCVHVVRACVQGKLRDIWMLRFLIGSRV